MRFIHVQKERVVGAESEPLRIEGDRLSNLYRWYADDAVRLAYLITGDRALAEDLVQDAFVKLAGRLVHLRGSSQPFEPYLRRTVVNLANSHFRRRKIERRYQEREASMLRQTRAGSGHPFQRGGPGGAVAAPPAPANRARPALLR
jgi:DNA-directed RNA polymerase specialized sigma24 family protein